jgi:K+-transporting ATPase ATPase C chain
MQTLRPAIVSLLVFTVLCGVMYPLAVGALAVLAFPEKARGSLVRDEAGKVIGSELVGQSFDHPAYLWGRPTAVAASASTATTSSGTNQGASGFVDRQGTIGPNPTLVGNVAARIEELRDADPSNRAKVPIDLVTASSSGLDPHISPAAAKYQAARIARARGAAEAEVLAIIDDHVEGRGLGILGEPRVNVFAVNRALDARFRRRGKLAP